jgi:hypothetical protein
MDKNTFPPVAVYAYNRPAQLAKTLACLQKNNIKTLYVFIDGPMGSEDEEGVDAVRRLVRSIRWISPEVVERSVNHGVRESMLLGLERVFSEHDRVVVVEDDIAVAPEFYAFMSACLDRYRKEDRIAGVTGLRYPFDRRAFDDYPYDVFLSPRFSSWGWGTWKRWWETIDFSHERAVKWLATTTDDELRIAGFDVPAMARYLAEGGLEWGATTADVYSLLHMIRNRQLFVCPTWNMVENLGFSDGTHASGSSQSWSLEWETMNDFAPEALRLPDDLRLTASVWGAFDAFLESIRLAQTASARRRPVSEIAKLVVREVTPPIVLRARRALQTAGLKALRRAGPRRQELSRGPRTPGVAHRLDPCEYTTTDGPTEVPVQKETH